MERDQPIISKFLRRKGRFILATNELDSDRLSSADILVEYKKQQCVENGFRFLKDPWFMVDSFYLKKRKRIEALMMIMTLCLLVYNFTQYKLRSSIKRENTTLPNQLGKEVQNPTLKWVFQIMEGIGIVKSFDESKTCTRAIITNLNTVRRRIVRILGSQTCKIYGIQMEIAGM